VLRNLVQLLKQVLHCRFKLRVLTVGDEIWTVVYVDIRVDAMVLRNDLVGRTVIDAE